MSRGRTSTFADRWGHTAADEAKANNQNAIHTLLTKASGEWATVGKRKRDARRTQELEELKALQEARQAQIKEREELNNAPQQEQMHKAAVMIQKHQRRRSALRLVVRKTRESGEIVVRDLA